MKDQIWANFIVFIYFHVIWNLFKNLHMYKSNANAWVDFKFYKVNKKGSTFAQIWPFRPFWRNLKFCYRTYTHKKISNDAHLICMKQFKSCQRWSSSWCFENSVNFKFFLSSKFQFFSFNFKKEVKLGCQYSSLPLYHFSWFFIHVFYLNWVKK